MKKFNLQELEKIIQNRIKSKDKNSYSYNLSKNPKLLNKKIIEEACELTLAKNKNQVAWEASDLLYFVLVFLAKRNARLKDIEKMLENRNKNINKSKNTIKSRKEGRK